MNPSTGPAFTSGVIETVYAITKAVTTHDREHAKVFHRYAQGSEQERAFDQGCEFACVRMLGGAEFAMALKTNNERN